MLLNRRRCQFDYLGNVSRRFPVANPLQNLALPLCQVALARVGQRHELQVHHVIGHDNFITVTLPDLLNHVLTDTRFGCERNRGF